MTNASSFSVTADLAFVPATLRPSLPVPATNDNAVDQPAQTRLSSKGWLTALITMVGSAAGIAAGLALTSAPVLHAAGEAWQNVCARVDAGACVSRTVDAIGQFTQGHEPPIAFATVIALFFLRGYVVRTITER